METQYTDDIRMIADELESVANSMEDDSALYRIRQLVDQLRIMADAMEAE